MGTVNIRQNYFGYCERLSEFENNIAFVQISKPFEPCFSAAESCVIDNEVKLLLEMNVIEELSEYADLSDGFISTIFTRPKRNGSYRVI